VREAPVLVAYRPAIIEAGGGHDDVIHYN
jgi:hypothetical protein